jgi:orotate phosphoribosyltransferase
MDQASDGPPVVASIAASGIPHAACTCLALHTQIQATPSVIQHDNARRFTTIATGAAKAIARHRLLRR